MTKIKLATNSNNQEIKFSLITLVLILFCSFLCVIATFTQLKIFIPSTGHFKIINYIPQIPVILFIAGLLGKKFGMTSVIIYIITGLFLVPVFALGGGLDYILNMNFGYILAFIPAVYFASKIITNKTSFLTLFLGNIVGILTIHCIGIAYLSAILFIQKESLSHILSWIINQSFDTIFIDLLFGLAAISLGCLIRNILKKIA